MSAARSGDATGDATPPALPLLWLPSLAVVAYLGAASWLWYAQRGQSFWGTHAAVIPLSLGGAALWLALLCWRGRLPLRHLDRRTWLVLASALGLFALFWLYGRRPAYRELFGPAPGEPPIARLLPFFYFAAASVVLRMLAPLALARAALGLRPSALGYRRPRLDRSGWLYVAAVAVAVPAVAYASHSAAFAAKYPLCRQAIEGGTLAVSTFAIYQLAYAAVFASGEAFWRGYIAFGLERRLGYNGLFFMLVPYVIGHFGKPQAEAFGAVAAGLFLGVLALRHRSFWLGAAVHWSVALMMDLWALHRRGVEWGWG